MIFQVRTARPSIVMNGTDYFQKLAPYFLNMAYTDNCDGQRADDLQLQLADRDNRFINDWMPDKGAFIDAGIIAERWFAPNAAALKLDCGRFWIDEIEFELPQHTVSIKATSIPTTGHIKASNETRGWDDSTLQDIANQIGQENKLQVDWRSDYNPQYKRVEQQEQSGLEFLKQRALDAKLAIKMTKGQMIFYDEEVLEAAPPAFAIIYGEGMPGGALQSLGAFAPLAAGGAGMLTGGKVYRMSGGKFTTKLIDTTKKATVSYASLANGKVSSGEHIDGDEKAVDDWHTNINQNTDCSDEDEDEENGGDGTRAGDPQPIEDWNQKGPSASATRLAKSKVRGKNKDRIHAEIEMSIGNPLIAAGQVFVLQGVGKYDGNWYIESVQHKVAPTYTTTLQARVCLKGF